MVALVDPTDLERCLKFKWSVHSNRGRPAYAARTIRVDGKCRRVKLHRFIQDEQPGQIVDHVNGVGVDCRRCNLRLATQAENARNARPRQGGSSRFKGVSQFKGRWRAQIMADKRYVYLGLFGSEGDAARAYDTAAKRLHGEFARLNFPEVAHE